MKPSAHSHDHRSGFGTLTLIGIAVLLLVITGIGQAIWRHGTQLGAYCRDAMLSINFNYGLDTCDAIGQSVVGFQRHLEGLVGSSSFGDSMNLEEFSGQLARQFAGATIGFNAPQLSGLIDPSLLQTPNLNISSPTDRLSLSLTRGAHGNALMQRGNASGGLSFLQSSANMGDVGVLSQLQLGSAYAQGSGGLPADPSRARHYYSQALSSIQSLESSRQPGSQQLLGALPAEPSQMKAHLQRLIQPQ